ncbi:MAG: glutamate mutase L, partial [Anaerolineae bacterium]|nr:glutamate mutase L [Anaerolineae bacterium]
MTQAVNSILVADMGSVHTRLILIDMVEGQYRLVASSRARTTAEPPLSSVSLGLDHAAQNMTDLIGRNFIDSTGEQLFISPEQDGHGVDAFLATSSAGQPMRVLLVGLTPEISLASGERVLAGGYVTLTDLLSPDDVRTDEEQINTILATNPDLIIIVGGTDDGATDIVLDQVKTVKRALSLIRQGSMPNVLYAGNHALRKQVRAMLSEYTEVYFAKNVRPTLDNEQLFHAQLELALVYDDFRSRSHGGFDEVARQSKIGAILPTTQGYISAIRYMSELPQTGVGPLIIDVGSTNSLIVAGVRKTPHYRIRTDLGMGHHAVSALEAVTVENVQRWLPEGVAAETLWDYVHNKALRPATIPATKEDLQIEQALAREIVRLLVREARPVWDLGVGELLPAFQPIIGAGAILTETQHPGISAMLLLDALQPVGAVELKLDPHNLIASLGVIAYLEPTVTVQALEAGGLVNLGTAFCPLGRLRPGQDAMYVLVRQENGTVINQTVHAGEIWMAPVLPGVSAEVTIRLKRGLSINGKRQISRRVIAGAAGIVFDARGRPL